MPQVIQVKILNQEQINQKVKENYQKLMEGIGFNGHFPLPRSISFFGSDSDANSATLTYDDSKRLYLFHKKYRNWLDASFLEVDNKACLYDGAEKPIGGIRTYNGDRGSFTLTTALTSKDVIPYLVFPAFLGRIDYTPTCLSCPDSSIVERVAKGIISAIASPPLSLLNALSDERLVTCRNEDERILDKICSEARFPFQKFEIAV